LLIILASKISLNKKRTHPSGSFLNSKNFSEGKLGQFFDIVLLPLTYKDSFPFWTSKTFKRFSNFKLDWSLQVTVCHKPSGFQSAWHTIGTQDPNAE
jgi:hypothetical protein